MQGPTPTRRSFLAGIAATTAALVIPLRLTTAEAQHAPAPFTPQPHAFIRIGTDGRVTFLLPTSEMGQGTHTGQAQILADELGAGWATISVDMPRQPTPDYRPPFMGQMRSVGSNGIRFWHDPLRRAAAQAREMLTAAAAGRLGVDASTLRAQNGRIVDPASDRAIPFGDLVAEAMALPVPENPTLRPEAELSLIGRSVPRLDTHAKVTGRALFGIDTRREGQLYAAVRLAPVFGSDVAAINEASVMGMPGVRAVVRVPRGAVVVATGWWQAKQAADALDISFTATQHDDLTTQAIDAMMRAALDRRDVPMTTLRGDAAAALSAQGRVVVADYHVPMLAHACMEPLNCTATSTDERTEIWTGTQGHDVARMTLEAALQIPAERLFINTPYLGGGFGRRTSAEVVLQAVLASRAVGGHPVKLLWAREDDMQQGLYRQTMMCRMRAALDDAGNIQGLHVRVAGPQMGRASFRMDPDTVARATGNLANFDPLSLNGLWDMRYEIPNLVVDHAVIDLPVTFNPWRGIAHSFTAFFLESFIDECAAAAGRDPLEYRRAHCAGQPRMLAVLDRVAEMSGWGQAAPPGISRGLALAESYGSFVAEVVELRVTDGRPVATRVFAAIDCGRTINPGQVEAQVQGGVIDGLGAALAARITLRDGRAEQSNFHDYALPRINEAPHVEVAIVDTGSPLGGAGEPGLPPVAPAFANAVFAAQGRRLRNLPLSDAL
ncbi:xanthine dehydrogenase family protein molybdopterin-binding subunit [Fertoebacter nigrum]|uniref:Xanthine dehydrogenase family protein molybdopterin-binding subunit n=1 Tax=Fertoeibacter niger TaxID=2656921 RepID=A0A8X8GW61_9RHOB|nr:molybdopterin cofactor-binding domain-containing protein [Fertoeibacter niger]NUB45489.1 xanthine dehydrogenase family protein molybdopterin-binding subunit [Fertoeibacter niger]